MAKRKPKIKKVINRKTILEKKENNLPKFSDKYNFVNGKLSAKQKGMII